MEYRRAELSPWSARLVVAASGTGLLLALLSAPLWLFYVAPVVAVPLVIGDLRARSSKARSDVVISPRTAFVTDALEGVTGRRLVEPMVSWQRSRRRPAMVWLVVFAILLAAVSAAAIGLRGGTDIAEAPKARTSPHVRKQEHPKPHSYPPSSESPAASSAPPHQTTPPRGPVSEATGGSTPLVPILIAVVVLAAISVGVVLYRQRVAGGQRDRGSQKSAGSG